MIRNDGDCCDSSAVSVLILDLAGVFWSGREEPDHPDSGDADRPWLFRTTPRKTLEQSARLTSSGWVPRDVVPDTPSTDGTKAVAGVDQPAVNPRRPFPPRTGDAIQPCLVPCRNLAKTGPHRFSAGPARKSVSQGIQLTHIKTGVPALGVRSRHVPHVLKLSCQARSQGRSPRSA